MESNHDPYRNEGLEIVGCPQCAAPAEVVERFVLASTDGPVEHVTVRCVLRHWFALPVEYVTGAASPRTDGKESAR